MLKFLSILTKQLKKKQNVKCCESDWIEQSDMGSLYGELAEIEKNLIGIKSSHSKKKKQKQKENIIMELSKSNI